VLNRLALVVALLATAFAAASAALAAPTLATKTIATASSSDFRADLVARRSGAGAAPTATVMLRTYRHAAGGWQRLSSRKVGGTYFWKTVTGPRALCRFELASAAKAHVTVQLLVSPSLGCGNANTVTLPAR
jgi:hypothetical protein